MSDENQGPVLFRSEEFGFKGPFKALISYEQSGKCLASNKEKELSLKPYNQFEPHPDTLFLITEVTKV